MEYANSLSARMKNARISAKMTQAEVAKALGITAQAISNFERGKGSLSSQNLNALCGLYGIDPATLNDQGIPDANDVAAHLDSLILRTYTLEPELLDPVVKCIDSFLDAIDDIFRQYNIAKKNSEIDRSMAEQCCKLESELKTLPTETDIDRDRIEAYKRQIREYKRFNTIDFKYLIDKSYILALDQTENDLGAFSRQLKAFIDKTTQETGNLEKSDCIDKE